MILLDVNVLVYGFREDAPEHDRMHAWLTGVLEGDEPVGLSEIVLAGFLRVVTHPKVFDPPTPLHRGDSAGAERRASNPGCAALADLHRFVPTGGGEGQPHPRRVLGGAGD